MSSILSHSCHLYPRAQHPTLPQIVNDLYEVCKLDNPKERLQEKITTCTCKKLTRNIYLVAFENLSLLIDQHLSIQESDPLKNSLKNLLITRTVGDTPWIPSIPIELLTKDFSTKISSLKRSSALRTISSYLIQLDDHKGAEKVTRKLYLNAEESKELNLEQVVWIDYMSGREDFFMSVVQEAENFPDGPTKKASWQALIRNGINFNTLFQISLSEIKGISEKESNVVMPQSVIDLSKIMEEQDSDSILAKKSCHLQATWEAGIRTPYDFAMKIKDQNLRDSTLRKLTINYVRSGLLQMAIDVSPHHKEDLLIVLSFWNDPDSKGFENIQNNDIRNGALYFQIMRYFMKNEPEEAFELLEEYTGSDKNVLLQLIALQYAKDNEKYDEALLAANAIDRKELRVHLFMEIISLKKGQRISPLTACKELSQSLGTIFFAIDMANIVEDSFQADCHAEIVKGFLQFDQLGQSEKELNKMENSPSKDSLLATLSDAYSEKGELENALKNAAKIRTKSVKIAIYNKRIKDFIRYSRMDLLDQLICSIKQPENKALILKSLHEEFGCLEIFSEYLKVELNKF